MKKQVLLVIISFFAFIAFGQIKTPQASPASKIEQTVGLTEMSVEFSRPSMRGRTIFGGLVPYGKLWRTGANKNTVVTFSDDVVVDGQTLKAGSYALFTKPGKSSWEVFFYSNTDNWGIPEKWDDAKVAAKTTTQVYEMPMDIESFTISVDDLSNNSAVLSMLWENVYVGVAINFPTDEKVTAAIEQTMSGEPNSNDYFAAAVYYLDEGKDIKKAKEWIDLAMKDNSEPKFWQLRKQSLIYAKVGDKKGAIALAKKSLAGAEKAGNADYIKMNEDSLKEWGVK